MSNCSAIHPYASEEHRHGCVLAFTVNNVETHTLKLLPLCVCVCVVDSSAQVTLAALFLLMAEECSERVSAALQPAGLQEPLARSGGVGLRVRGLTGDVLGGPDHDLQNMKKMLFLKTEPRNHGVV